MEWQQFSTEQTHIAPEPSEHQSQTSLACVAQHTQNQSHDVEAMRVEVAPIAIDTVNNMVAASSPM